MAFRVYTKTGDKGTTALIGGVRVPKDHIRIEAYGTVDELNSFVGLVKDSFGHEATGTVLQEIQDRLFTIGAILATPPDKDVKMALPDLYEDDITYLEQAIDQMDAVLPEMKSFILPGGDIVSSYAHLARCVCRRAERLCVGLNEGEEVNLLVMKYLNRLSDYLFVLARFILHVHDKQEVPWRPRVR